MQLENNVISKIAEVSTISGNRVQRRNCVKIREKYHEKNKDCFRINEKWVSAHFNRIAIDDTTGQYDFVSKLKPCLVTYDAKSANYKLGMTRNPYSEVFNLTDQPDQNIFYAINKEIYDSLNLEICPVSGNKYPFGRSPHKTKKLKYKKGEHDFKYAISLAEGRNNGLETSELQGLGVLSKLFSKTQGMNYTFGVELETSGGVIPKHIAANNLNINYIYDGSVYSNSGQQYGGGEIITGVLHGDNGLTHLEKICKEAADRCEINPTCGVHIHIGGAKFTEEFTVNAYMLSYMLQDDLFTYMPKKRRYQVDYKGAVQGDNVYCKMMPHLELYDFDCSNKSEFNASIHENYKRIFRWLSGGIELSSKCNNKTQHPKGHKCGYDHRSARYHWLNLVPTNFNTRGNGSLSLEFRNHGETLDYTKVYYWLLFCFAFTHFCENKTNFIIDGCITDKQGVRHELNVINIIKHVYTGALRDNLVDYFNDRKNFFSKYPDSLEMGYKYSK